MKKLFFAINRDSNRAEILTGFRYWEEVEGALRVGILMSDGNSANGIGRCASLEEFCRKANHGGTTILMPEENPFTLEIECNGARSEVAADVWRSWTGRRFINGNEAQGQRFIWQTNKPAKTPLETNSQDFAPCPRCGESHVNCGCDPICPKTHKVW